VAEISRAGTNSSNSRRIQVGWVVNRPNGSVASYRLRCCGVLPLLSERGVSAKLVPLRRVDETGIDVAIFSKKYGNVERDAATSLSRRGVKVILDLCDNHLLSHPEFPQLIQRRELLLRMIDAVDLVTCSTPTLAAFIPHPNVEVVDDLLEEIRTPFWGSYFTSVLSYSIWPRPAKNVFKLIWFGRSGKLFPPFGLCDVERMLPVLDRLHREIPLSLTVVSDSREKFNRFVHQQAFLVEYFSWRSWMMPHLLRRHHVCLIPINENDFTRCKTANRAAFALRCGVPVVAEPIPSYAELAEYIEVGDLEQGIRRVIEDVPSALVKVEKGREFIERRYASACIVAQWEAAILRAISTPIR
jgi:glycosyltransferase involved in cell wall biosynthesis